jgi:UDP-glucose 4-epimerase
MLEMAASTTVVGLTGSFGYIGKRLLARLAQADDFDRVICTDILDTAEPLPEGFRYHRCDVRDGQKLRRIFEASGVTAVVHLAFIAHPTRDSSFEYEVDVTGTENVLAACGQLGVRKLVVASSDCAYGFFENTPDYLTEDAPIRGTPGFPYSENKARVEEMIADFASRFPECAVVVMRACTVIGPSVNNTTSRSMKQPLLVGFRGCDPIMQFVHEDDAAEAFYLALTRDVEGAFNLAADEGVRYSELARVIGRPLVSLPAWLMHPLVEGLYRVRLMPFGKAQLSYIRYPMSMDVEKIKRELGFRPRYSSRQTLESFLAAPEKEG